MHLFEIILVLVTNLAIVNDGNPLVILLFNLHYLTIKYMANCRRRTLIILDVFSVYHVLTNISLFYVLQCSALSPQPPSEARCEGQRSEWARVLVSICVEYIYTRRDQGEKFCSGYLCLFKGI